MRIGLESLGDVVDPSTGRTTPAGELRSRILRRRDEYLAAGLRPGDRVLLRHGNSPRFLIDLLAVWSAEGCAAPADPALPAPEFEAVLKETGCSFVSSGDAIRFIGRVDCGSADARLLLLTSGTSGRPKAILHSFQGLQSRFRAWGSRIKAGDLSETLCFLPTHFGHGLLANCLFPLLQGARLHVVPPFDFNLLATLDQYVDRHSITFMSSVPSAWNLITRFAESPRQGSLKRIHCASAPFPADLWKVVERWGGDAAFVNCYGLTEVASWVASTEGCPGARDTGCVGRAWDAQFEIREGEVWVRADSLMLGYHGRPELTARVVRDGWLNTGDLGRIDAEGRIFLTGRTGTLINKAGMKISPEEVEAVMKGHPAVSEVCVFGLPDPLSGETVAAAVVFAGSVPAPHFEDLEAWCRERISPFKVPTRWFGLDALPKTSNGKPDRRSLVNRFKEEGRHGSGT